MLYLLNIIFFVPIDKNVNENFEIPYDDNIFCPF